MSSVQWKDTGWSSVVATASQLGTVKVRAGVVGPKASEPNGGGPLTNGEVAILNEFGTDDGHVPERSFIRATFERNQGAAQTFLAAAVRRAVFGGARPELALRDVGAWATSEIRKTIAAGVKPENKPATIALKGSSHTLVDTGDMLDAVGYELTTSNEGPTLDEGQEEFEIFGEETA